MAEVNVNIKELDLVTTTMSNKSAAQAGCNSFGLVTTDRNDNGDPVPIMCTGLLTELPSFSISPTYDLSPGKTVLDLYTNVFKKDEFDVAAVLMAASNTEYNPTEFEWQNTIQAGTMTRGMFKSVSYGDFSLKFKVYAQNAFGQSPISEWKALLSKFATPSTYATTSANTLLNNIQGALTILEGNGSAIYNELNKGRSCAPRLSEYEKKKHLIDYKKNKSTELLTKFCKLLNNSRTQDAMSEISIEFNGFFEPDLTPGRRSDKYFVPTFKVVKNGQATISFIKMSGIDFLIFDNTELKFENVSKLSGFLNDWNEAYWFKYPNVGEDGIEDFNESAFYKKVLKNSGRIDKFKDILIEFLGVKNFYEKLTKDKGDKKYDYHNMFEQLKINQSNNIRYLLEQTVEELWNVLYENNIPNAPTSFIGNLAEHTKNTLNNVEQFITDTGFLTNYGENRVYEELNRKTQLGEKLWHLYIYYPWFFKKPITVCITDWSFTPSKQLQTNNGKPVYHEVEIKCKMDQIPSRETWGKLFSDICYAN